MLRVERYPPPWTSRNAPREPPPAACEQPRTAHETLATKGGEAFAGRARRDLLATGETVRKRTVEWHCAR
jgi:hypothetical protein